MALWASMVGPGMEMDYKGRLFEAYGEWIQIPGSDGSVRYDVFGNVSYGAVGKEVGFSERVLIGASHVSGVAGIADPADDVAIDVGFQLADQTDLGMVRPEDILGAIQANWDALREWELVK